MNILKPIQFNIKNADDVIIIGFARKGTSKDTKKKELVTKKEIRQPFKNTKLQNYSATNQTN